MPTVAVGPDLDHPPKLGLFLRDAVNSLANLLNNEVVVDALVQITVVFLNGQQCFLFVRVIEPRHLECGAAQDRLAQL